MSTKKIIAIFGATGNQGGGLAHAILQDPQSEFAVRAITRDPNSEKAQALKNLGAEVVAGDIDDLASVKKSTGGSIWSVSGYFLLGPFFTGERAGGDPYPGGSSQQSRIETRDLVNA